MKARRHSLSGYIPPSSDPCKHFKIVLGETYWGFEELSCLLARAWAGGNFETLNPAWRMLGYSPQELAGRCVGELIALEPDAARAASMFIVGDVLRAARARSDVAFPAAAAQRNRGVSFLRS